jgi:hypothetical protein
MIKSFGCNNEAYKTLQPQGSGWRQKGSPECGNPAAAPVGQASREARASEPRGQAQRRHCMHSGSGKTNQDFVEMLVCLLPCLQDTFGIINSTRVSLQPKEDFPGSRRAIDASLALDCMIWSRCVIALGLFGEKRKGRRWGSQGRSKGVKTGEMVAVDMAEKTGQRRP